MAIRVTAHEVIELLPTSLADRVVKGNMITTASNYVDVHLASAGHSATTLKHIEMYLAAHCVAITEEKGGIVSDEFGDSKVEFAEVYGEGFNSTRFGQMAIILDTSGTLAAKSTTKPKAQFRVIQAS